MSDGTNFYNRLIGYVLWINREGQEQPERLYVLKGQLIGDKQYKVTLRNTKLYIEELKKKDPTIESVMIDRLSRVGEYKWENDTAQNERTD